MTKALKRKIAKIVSAALSVLIVLLMLLIGYLVYCNLSGNVAYFGKYAVARIVSPSMEPTIPVDEYILVKKVPDPDALKQGDVILFRSHDPAIYGKLNTHRIVEVAQGENGTEFVTKGDNNPVNDSLRTASSDVVGKYVKNLNAVSAAAKLLAGRKIFFLLILIPTALLVFVCIRDVIKKSKEVKMELLVKEQVEALKAEAEANKNSDDKKE